MKKLVSIVRMPLIGANSHVTTERILEKVFSQGLFKRRLSCNTLFLLLKTRYEFAENRTRSFVLYMKEEVFKRSELNRRYLFLWSGALSHKITLK